MIFSPQSKLYLLTTMYTRSITVLRKVVLDRPGPADSFRMETVDFDSSASLSPNYVRVQVAATAVAYRDLIDRKGGFPFMNQPTVLGHEIAGVVEASANSNFKKGNPQYRFGACFRTGPQSSFVNLAAGALFEPVDG